MPEITTISVKQYHRMIAAGVLTENDAVELLEERLFATTPPTPRRATTISCMQRVLELNLGDDWFVRVRSAITTRDSEPEPDLAVVSEPMEKYFQHHPSPFDIGLLIEVSDSTLERDRMVKGRLYARARIPIYWIVNLAERTIEVYTRPVAGKQPHYRDRRDFGMEDEVPLVIEKKEVARIAVKELLPPG